MCIPLSQGESDQVIQGLSLDLNQHQDQGRAQPLARKDRHEVHLISIV